MDIFNIIAGVASIISLAITLLTLNKVSKIENKFSIDNSASPKQSIKAGKNSHSVIKQAGRDIK